MYKYSYFRIIIEIDLRMLLSKDIIKSNKSIEIGTKVGVRARVPCQCTDSCPVNFSEVR